MAKKPSSQRISSEQVSDNPSQTSGFNFSGGKLKSLFFVAAFGLVGVAALLLTNAAPGGGTSIEGKVVIAHEDDFTNKKSNKKYSIKTNDGIFWELENPSDYTNLHFGSTVRVTGTTKPGHKIAPNTISPAPVKQAQSLHNKLFPKAEAGKPGPGPTNPPSGAKKVLVVPFNFKNDKSKLLSPDSVRSTVFTGQFGVNPALTSESLQKLSLTGRDRVDGDVTNYQTISQSSSEPCNTLNWQKEALTKSRVDPSGYDIIMYVSPKAATCAYDESAVMSTTAPSTIHFNGIFEKNIIVHGVGHTLGLSHSVGYYCTDNAGTNPVTINLDYSKCRDYVDGDPFDYMSLAKDRPNLNFNAYHKAQLGWLSASSVKTVTANGDYELLPLGVEVAGAQLLKIPTQQGKYPITVAGSGPITEIFPQFYYLEFRNSGYFMHLGADSSIGTPSVSSPPTRFLDGNIQLTDVGPPSSFLDGQFRSMDDGVVKIEKIDTNISLLGFRILWYSGTPNGLPTNFRYNGTQSSGGNNSTLTAVEWDPPSGQAPVSYRIYASSPGDPTYEYVNGSPPPSNDPCSSPGTRVIAQVSGSTTSLSAGSLPCGTQSGFLFGAWYHVDYYVTAVYGDGSESAPSNSVYAAYYNSYQEPGGCC